MTTGETVRVLVDGPDPEREGGSVGRSEGDAPEIDRVVRIDETIPPGRFVAVRIAGSAGYDIEGSVVEGSEPS